MSPDVDSFPVPALALLGFVTAQRLVELALSRRNLRRTAGAQPVPVPVDGRRAEWIAMVVVHGLLVLLPALEVLFLRARASIPLAWAAGLAFALAEVLRGWSLSSLGRAWNARAIVAPDLRVVDVGPYRWIRHPNYLAVLIEFSAVPLFCGAWRSWIVLNLLHAPVLLLRIRAEERLLGDLPDYRARMSRKGRFLPRRAL
jgi:methyltransferase